MNLFQRIGNGLMAFATQDLEPWLAALLTSVSHAEATVLLPIATKFVANLETSFIAAAASGNLSGFAALAGEAALSTAKEAETASIAAAGTTVLTAVAAALASHPGIAAAVAAAPKPAVQVPASLAALDAV